MLWIYCGLVAGLAVLCGNALAASKRDRLQNRDFEASSLPPILLGPLLIAAPPLNYTLGISLLIALNIRGALSRRLNSVISQELLNPKTNGLGAYWTVVSLSVLSESVIEVTQELNNLVGKPTFTNEDLQGLINASSCSNSSISISVKYIPILWSRLQFLYWSNPTVGFSQGCDPREIFSTTESTTDLTTATVNRNHELPRKHEKGRQHVQDYIHRHHVRNSNNHEHKVLEARQNHKGEQ